MNTFRSIKEVTHAEFRDRGSKFLASAHPINHPDEVKGIVNELKKVHPKAVHHCLAFRIGTEGLLFRANDDGEPSGSAGKPILGQIDSAGLTNVLVVVTRYFGGTLLGVPGLINAYKTVTAEVLQHCEIIERNIEFMLSLSFDYTIMNEVLMILKRNEVTIYKNEMQLFCEYSVGIPLATKTICLEQLSKIHGVTIL